MNRKALLFIFASFILVLTLGFVFSVETCCEIPKQGSLCQTGLTQNQCTGQLYMTPCETHDPCSIGTCVSENSGECIESSRKFECLDAGNEWFDIPEENIIVGGVKVCRDGCCTFGQSSALMTYAECQSLSFSEGVTVGFDQSITDETQCTLSTGGLDEVACLVTDVLALDCKRTTEQECNSIGGDPHKGWLCTAPQLATNCAKTEKTVCRKGKVYFLDSCGNLANIYDETMFSKNPGEWDPIMKDYWTYIKKPSQSCSINPTNDFSSECGNCNELQGTICESYDIAEKNLANLGLTRPIFGENVCSSLDCSYDTDGNPSTPEDYYQHGESWCAEAKGTNFHIKVSNESGQFQQQDKTREILTNFIPGTEKNNFKQSFAESYNEYNFPGTRYTRLYCIDGTVYEDPCNDFRNQICMESNMGDLTGNFKTASCMKNDYSSCMNYTDKTSCEKGILCKWIYGHRFDGANLNTIEDKNIEKQGSCIPLFAPGIQFWASEEEGIKLEESVCKFSNLGVPVRYETSIWRSRSNLEGQPFCDTSSGNRNFDRTSDCQNNCYALPTYGRKDANEDYFSLEDLMGLHKGIDLSETLDNTCLSDRKSHYCEGKTGPISGASPNCAGNPGDRKIMPLFFRHDEWLLSIKDRARSMGDCGYKKGIFMQDFEGLDKDLESVYTIFEMESGSYDAKKLYEGDFSSISTISLN